MLDQLPTEVASTVLKFLNSSELMTLAPQRLPTNFEEAMHHQSLWRHKLVSILTASDYRHCMANMSRVQHCQRVSFAASQLSRADMLRLLKAMRHVEYVSLEGFLDLDDHALQQILNLHGRTIKYLNISGCQYLTNFSLSQLARRCRSLHTLIVAGCSFSAAGIEVLAETAEVANSIRVLDISRCYLLDQTAIRPLSQLVNLQRISMRHMDWLNASNMSYIVGAMSRLQSVDIQNCDDFTRHSIRQMKEALSHPVHVIENVKLDDESPESIRGYLMALISSTAVC